VKKLLWVVLGGGVVLAATGFGLYLTNTTPLVPAVTTEEAADSSRPFVVKLHAQWCPLCMVTTGVWAEVEQAYAGRVNLLVLDFTDDATAAASREEARRLKLDSVLAGYEGVTGAVLVLDGRTREVVADISGSRDFAEYRTAIDAVLPGDR
jgi:thiol-disulfide isomerase/thioredoxin